MWYIMPWCLGFPPFSINVTLTTLQVPISTMEVTTNCMKGGSKVAKVANNTSSSRKKIRPALTPEAREKQMISLAMDLVEQRLIDGTASSQETTHFLKLATSKANLEKEKLERENELLRAKTDAIESAKNIEKLYTDAISAMKRYSGQGSVDDENLDEWY